jgi:hypothetical protein
MIYTALHRQLKIEVHQPHLKPGGQLRRTGGLRSSHFTYGTSRVTLGDNHVISHE